MSTRRSHSKKKRIILWIAGVALVLLLTVDLLGGNYLVTFAISRSTASGVSVAPTSQTSDESNARIASGWQRIREKVERWRDTAAREEVSIQSGDGLRLVGDYFPADGGGHRYLLAIHGYTATRGSMTTYAQMYAAHGFHVLMPDMRGHGDSEGAYIGMGWLDRKDVLGWIDWIIRRDPQAQIVLHGVSMGGATVMMTAGETLPPHVIAAVEDCGYTSVWDEFTDEMDYLFHLPPFPLLHTASAIARLRAGYSFREASALKQVRQAQIPILFIHGSADNFVNSDMVYPLYEACPTQKALYIAEGAGHGEALLLDPEIYEQQVFDFLGQFMEL